MPKIDPETVAAARARFEVYGSAVRLRRSGAWMVGKCPLHEDHSPSFAVRNGRWKCFAGCGAGDTIDFVMRLRNVDFAAAVVSLAGGNAVSPPRSSGQRLGSPARDTEDDAKRTALAVALWESADAPRLAELYLFTRGIAGPLPDALRGHKTVWCAESRSKRPAVLAAVTDARGAVLAVQRIWCETRTDCSDGMPAKGARSLDLRAGKKTLGPCRDGAVRLAPAGPMLGLAEGVETALSCRKLFRIPTWATLGTARLGSVTLPDVVRQVVIFGDGGDAGRAAGEKAVSEYSRRGYSVASEYPAPGCSDFNEQLIGRRLP